MKRILIIGGGELGKQLAHLLMQDSIVLRSDLLIRTQNSDE